MAIYYGDGTNSNGSSNGGRIVQTLTSHKSGITSHTGQSWSSNIGGLTQAITMSDSNNKVLILYTINMSAAANVYSGQARIVRGSTALGQGAISTSAPNQIAANNHFFTSYDSYSSYGMECLANGFLDTPGSGTHTYAVQMRSGYNNYAVWCNRSYADSNYNNSASSSSFITLFEIAHS
tara:strand:+ start:1315 stop:1851 length:537 start_codon:yes stop_codon:yes gene_type:complete